MPGKEKACRQKFLPAGFAVWLLFVHAVVRCFFCNMNIMRMALFQRCSRNLHKSAVLPSASSMVFGSTVAHTGTQAAHQLEYRILYTFPCMPHGLLRLPEPVSWRQSGNNGPCFRFPWLQWNPYRGILCIFFPDTVRKFPGSHHSLQTCFPSCRHCAPAAMAFVISPEYLIPPSAMIGIPYSFATS